MAKKLLLNWKPITDNPPKDGRLILVRKTSSSFANNSEISQKATICSAYWQDNEYGGYFLTTGNAVIAEEEIDYFAEVDFSNCDLLSVEKAPESGFILLVVNNLELDQGSDNNISALINHVVFDMVFYVPKTESSSGKNKAAEYFKSLHGGKFPCDSKFLFTEINIKNLPDAEGDDNGLLENAGEAFVERSRPNYNASVAYKDYR